MSSSSMEDQATREAQASEEEHRRRLANRQRLRELRIKRLRAKVWALCAASCLAVWLPVGVLWLLLLWVVWSVLS